MSIDRSEADLQHPGTADPRRDDAPKPDAEDVNTFKLGGSFQFYDAASAAELVRNSLPVVEPLRAAQFFPCDACEGAPEPYAHLGGPGGSHFCRRHAREALAKTNPPTRFTNRRRSAMKAVAVVVAVLATAVTAIGLRLL